MNIANLPIYIFNTITSTLTLSAVFYFGRKLQILEDIQITREGRELIKQIGFDKVFLQHKDDFISYIDEEKPRLKYDVEQAAITAIHLNSNKSYMDF